MLAYDNAPQMGHRRWEHECGLPPSPPKKPPKPRSLTSPKRAPSIATASEDDSGAPSAPLAEAEDIMLTSNTETPTSLRRYFVGNNDEQPVTYARPKQSDSPPEIEEHMVTVVVGNEASNH
jgi:hypothetical protein